MQPIQKQGSPQYATQQGYLPRSPHRSFSQAPQQPLTPLPHRQRPLNFRKNACAVCRICFTCAKYYGQDCQCPEMHPRRGKNLPPNTVDSRSKRLSAGDPEDLQITMSWLEQHANERYRDTEGNLPANIAEFALCKAHSSSLYRAKKRAELNLAQRAQEQDFANSSQLPMSLPTGFVPTPSSSAKRKRMEDNFEEMRRLQQHRTNLSIGNPYTPKQQPPINFGQVVETISLRSALTEQERNDQSIISSGTYYLRNLAITDTFTFRDILREIDLTGTAPPGKKIVITNVENDRTYPMDIAIRSIIWGKPHVDLCIGVQDVVTFNLSGNMPT